MKQTIAKLPVVALLLSLLAPIVSYADEKYDSLTRAEVLYAHYLDEYADNAERRRAVRSGAIVAGEAIEGFLTETGGLGKRLRKGGTGILRGLLAEVFGSWAAEKLWSLDDVDPGFRYMKDDNLKIAGVTYDRQRVVFMNKTTDQRIEYTPLGPDEEIGDNEVGDIRLEDCRPELAIYNYSNVPISLWWSDGEHPLNTSLIYPKEVDTLLVDDTDVGVIKTLVIYYPASSDPADYANNDRFYFGSYRKYDEDNLKLSPRQKLSAYIVR